MKIVFEIPYPPTKAGRTAWSKLYGLNAYWAGKHWSQRKKDAEYWHYLVRAELRRQGVKPRVFKHPVYITFYHNDGLDIDNHAAASAIQRAANIIISASPAFPQALLKSAAHIKYLSRFQHFLYIAWQSKTALVKLCVIISCLDSE